MKKNLFLIWPFFWALLFSANIFAGDYAHFHFLGFSRGAKYLAFEEYGINDSLDDDTSYSTIYIVDVEKNSWAVEPITSKLQLAPFTDRYMKYDTDEVESRVREKTRRRAARQLKRFGIVDGNTGLQVVAHLINEYEPDPRNFVTTDNDAKGPVSISDSDTEANSNAGSDSTSLANSSANANTAASGNSNVAIQKEAPKPDPLDDYIAYLPQQVAFTKRGNALYRDGYYELAIKPVSVTQTNCDEYERDMFSFELTLKNERGETQQLQKAGKVPKNRGCTNGYGIQEVFLYRNKLAVFIGIFTRGWEGENMRLMSVTGDLN